MRKIWLFVLAAVLLTGAFRANAGVRFITDVPQNSYYGKPSSGSSVAGNNNNRCTAAGYTKTRASCGDKVAVKPCPYNKRMFKACCDREYSHSKEYCLSRGLTPSRRSCEGMYACEQK